MTTEATDPPPPGAATWAALVAPWLDADSPAVVDGTRTWSGRELARRAAAVSSWLDSVGAPPGRPVAALAAASAPALALVLAGMASGRPVAPLGTRLTAVELRRVIEPLGAAVLVVDHDLFDLGREAAHGTRIDVRVRPEVDDARVGIDLRATSSDVAMILHTSGTSGLPQRVDCRQGALAARARISAGLLAIDHRSRYVTASPFHHVAGSGMMLVALAAGACVHPLPRFTPGAWRAALDDGVTHALLVPAMIEAALDDGLLDGGSLTHLHYGAAAIRPATLRRLVDALPAVDLAQIYGQTEGAPITCLTPGDHRRALAGDHHLLASQGRVVPGSELRIDRPDRDGVGEVVVRGPQLFAPGPDGWLHTGDAGRLDHEGYLFLSGRLGDMIIRGGENVHPDEVEHVVAGHPWVREVAVVGRPDDRLGERITAFVVPRSPAGGEPPVDDLREHARRSLAGHKVPDLWIVVDDLPRNAAGKVLRRKLRARIA